MNDRNFLDYLEHTAPALLARDKLPGAAVALIEDGATAQVRTWGHADIALQKPVEGNTLFNVASISKPFTAWGVMKLVERGLVQLDEPVEDYLGGWRLPPSGYDHDLITVRRLLSHTGGINTDGVKAVGPPYGSFSTRDVLEGRLPGLDSLQREYCLKWAIDPDRDRDPVSVSFQPGGGFHYSNMGFVLLQLLIEQVSGRSFSDFMQSEILEPVGMRTASFDPAASSDPLAAVAYGSDGKALPRYRHVALAAAGLFCSIEALAAFACAELNGGGNVISAQGVDALFERQCFAETMQGMDFDAGLGHYRLDANELTLIMHTGGVPGWRSVYAVIPRNGRGFCALINSDGGNDFFITLLQAWFMATAG